MGQLEKPSSRAMTSCAAARLRSPTEVDGCWRATRSTATGSPLRAASRSSLAWRRSWSRSGRCGSEVDMGVSLLRLRSAAQAEEEATAMTIPSSEVDSVLPADPAAPSSANNSLIVGRRALHRRPLAAITSCQCISSELAETTPLARSAPRWRAPGLLHWRGGETPLPARPQPTQEE